MAVHYIVDGYNAAHRQFAITGQALAAVRESLVRVIETSRPHGSHKNAITVVFDGRADLSAPSGISPVRVVFSRQETADAVIKRMVESSSQPHNLVVVSDDRQVMYACRAAGAKVMSVQRFFSVKAPAPAVLRKHRDSPQPSLNPDSPEAATITEELRRLWVKE